MECESCLKSESEVDALIGGEYKRMCKTCAHLEGAVVIEKPARNNVMDSYKRATVREVLLRMSGMPKNRPVQQAANNLRLSPVQTNRVMIGGKKREEEYFPNNSASSNRIVSNFPQRSQAQQAQAPVAVQALEAESQAQKVQPKKGFFSRLFGGRSNEPETPSPTNGPSLPPMGGLSGAKRTANADDGVLEL